MPASFPVSYNGTSGALAIDSPAPGVIVITTAGHDVGEFGSEPMEELEEHLPEGRSVLLFVDARRTRGVTIEVSSEWARWLGMHRSRFERISFLTGSRFIQITAEFVRSFSDLHGIMRIYRDAEAFDEALAASVAGAEDD